MNCLTDASTERTDDAKPQPSTQSGHPCCDECAITRGRCGKGHFDLDWARAESIRLYHGASGHGVHAADGATA